MTPSSEGPPEYVKFAAFYDLSLEPVLHHIRRRVARWLTEHPVKRALDVGCGTGKQIAMLPPELDVIGVDLSPAMLRQAERQAPGRCRLADATELPFEDASFDVIYTQFALHEKSEAVIDGLLREAHRLLRPDGHLLVVDYAIRPHRWPLGPIAHPVVAMVEALVGGEHARHYREWMARGGIDRVVPDAGFVEVESVDFWGGPIKLGVYTAVE